MNPVSDSVLFAVLLVMMVASVFFVPKDDHHDAWDIENPMIVIYLLTMAVSMAVANFTVKAIGYWLREFLLGA